MPHGSPRCAPGNACRFPSDADLLAGETAFADVTPKREDSYLAERILRALWASGYPSLHAVKPVVSDHLVTLEGRVPTYYMKQLAQTYALDVPGVRQLRNEVQVGRVC